MKNSNDYFEILRKIQKKPESSQRELAENLGFSLGKLNYCIKSLQDKGLIKIKNFKDSQNKLNYLYLLTPKGLSHKTNLTLTYMKKKMIEYDELKKEIYKD
tara:strand:- start:62 stop:364 length:303 start_codon:yes stop_codon:yes gene_type:complete